MAVPSDVDVIVLGTGAAGLTAAITAHEHGATVAVFEKADQVGGTSAWSGGMVWMPANHVAAEAGVADSRDEGLTYLAALLERDHRSGARGGVRRRRQRDAALPGGPDTGAVPARAAGSPTTTPSTRAGSLAVGGRWSARRSASASSATGPTGSRSAAFMPEYMTVTDDAGRARRGAPGRGGRASSAGRGARRRPGAHRPPPEGVPRPRDRAPRRHAGHRPRDGRRSRHRRAVRRTPRSRCGLGPSCSRRAASSGTASSCGRSCAARSTTASRCPPTPVTG